MMTLINENTMLRFLLWEAKNRVYEKYPRRKEKSYPANSKFIFNTNLFIQPLKHYTSTRVSFRWNNNFYSENTSINGEAGSYEEKRKKQIQLKDQHLFYQIFL